MNKAISKPPTRQVSSVSEIEKLHEEILSAARSSLKKAIRVGELLAKIKDELEHGQWLPWIGDNLPFSDQTARNYIRVFENRDSLKFKTVLNLTQAIRLVTAPKGLPPKPNAPPVIDVEAEVMEPSPEPKLLPPPPPMAEMTDAERARHKELKAIIKSGEREYEGVLKAIKEIGRMFVKTGRWDLAKQGMRPDVAELIEAHLTVDGKVVE